jgi:hypothetical protein
LTVEILDAADSTMRINRSEVYKFPDKPLIGGTTISDGGNLNDTMAELRLARVLAYADDVATDVVESYLADTYTGI